jgi:uncharacterized protein YjbI with pentapeptide repeats
MKLFALITLAVVILLAFVGYLIRLGYLETGLTAYIDPTGDYHPAKTLWDWMELLIIPVVLAGGGLLYSWRERKAEREEAQQRAKREREIADDRNRETTLQNYLDKMTELLLEHDLRTSESAQAIARARTLTALRSLDAGRKGILLRFLQESDLIKTEKPVVSLKGADLFEADLQRANLFQTDLSEAILFAANLSEADLALADLSEAELSLANLSKANLDKAKLGAADLSEANLFKANLFEANLYGANLTGADLRGAGLCGAELIMADLGRADLRGAMYSDRTIWPNGFSPPSDAELISP